MAFRTPRRKMSDETLDEVRRLALQDHPELIEPAAEHMEQMLVSYREEARKDRLCRLGRIRLLRDVSVVYGLTVSTGAIAIDNTPMAIVGGLMTLPAFWGQSELVIASRKDEVPSTKETTLLEYGLALLEQRQEGLQPMQALEKLGDVR